MAFVGCHWSRGLPDGRMVHMSSFQRGSYSGYSLTINYECTEYPDLEAALTAYDQLAAAARKAMAATSS